MTTAVGTERRIIILGKTGNGKSSTGNSLLGRQAFYHEQSLNTVTQTCNVQKGDNSTNKKKYVIVDTPGLMDTEMKLAKRALEIQKSVEECPEPHAFLLIFSSNVRITKDEEFTIDMLRVIFGEKVFEQCIVVFTHGKRFSSADDFKRFWTKNHIMVQLVQSCGGRIAMIENGSPVDSDSHGDVQRILTMIENMSDHGQNRYSYAWLHVHQRELKEHLKNYDGKTDVREELSALVKKLGKRLNREIWKVRLEGGVLIGAGVGVIGAGGYGVVVAGNALAATATGATVMSNVAAAGSAIVGTAWTLATRLRFW